MSLAAGIALVLLPGLLVVRAPWTAVAPLSLAFWAVSAWWLPFAGPGRGRAVVAVLFASLLLVLLRLLPKHDVEPPPGWSPPQAPPPLLERQGLPPPPFRSWSSLLVLGTALYLLLPVPLWPNAPGERLAFQTTTARLMVWYDGIPANGEPLVPLEPIGAHAPAVATLTADLAELAGLDAGRAAAWAAASAAALLLVGLFALLATWAPPGAAALGALVALAVPPWPVFLAFWGDGEALVALVFVLPAVGLAAGHASRSSAAAAGLLLAAGALAQPALAAVAVASVGFVLRRAPQRSRAVVRLAWILGLALVFAAPGLWLLARTLSLAEASLVVRSIRASEVVWFALATLWAALAPLALRGLALDGSARGRAVRACLAIAAALLLAVRVHTWFAKGALPPRTLAALAEAARKVPPLTAVCAADGVRDFVPAFAGRRAGEPGIWVPPLYSEEWARREKQSCGVSLEDLAERQ